MQKKNIIIAEKTLLFLSKNSFEKLTVSKILSIKKNTSIKNKNDLLININRYFDFLLKKKLSFLEESSKKDMLFEILMARLDILNIYRKSIKNIFKAITSRPYEFLKLIPSFIESIILIATLSNINVSGLKGVAKIKTIFVLYLLIIFTWTKDETETLEKTMTTLDKYLNNLVNLDKYIKIFR